MTNERAKTHACDLRRYTFGNDEFNLEAAYHDCKLVFDGIADDDSFQESDTGLILYYANEIIYALHEALQGDDTNVLSNDCISRQAAIEALDALCDRECEYSKKQRSVMCGACHLGSAFDVVEQLPSAQTERLTDDDFETIRIHLNAYKEKLCNQQIWKEAEEYQRIIDRFMAFASAQQEIIRCGQCKYAEVADKEDAQDGYTCQFHRGSIWFSGSYCSWAERRTDENNNE